MISQKVFIQEIPCVIWLPGEYDSAKKYPWVVALSGKGEMGDGSDSDLTTKIINSTNFANLLTYADKLGLIVVMPQLVQSLNNWIPGYTFDYVNKAIDYTVSHYSVDLNRMYITGLSLGGGGVWNYITSNITNANRVAAAIPVCGVPIDGGDWSLIAKSNIPVWAFHAADDGTVGVSASRNQVAAANKYNPNPPVKYTEYSSGNHYIWGITYANNELYKWMLAQINNNVIVNPPPPAFKPTHKIVREDGSSELVRIETL